MAEVSTKFGHLFSAVDLLQGYPRADLGFNLKMSLETFCVLATNNVAQAEEFGCLCIRIKSRLKFNLSWMEGWVHPRDS
jgi:hypothetical protein